jgi:hypothetical protein
MATRKEGPPPKRSSFFYDALQAVRNMKNAKEEPLPGRKPSAAFWAAIKALASHKKGET